MESKCSIRSELSGVIPAVEHLQELRHRMKKEDTLFSQKDIANIDIVIQAIQELAKEVEHVVTKLETQTIQSSILRHHLHFFPGKLHKEWQDAILCAREANRTEFNTLQERLAQSEEMMKLLRLQHKGVEHENSLLYPDRDKLKEEHEDIVAQLNMKMSEKAGQQIVLNETRNAVRETNNRIIDVEEAMIQLKEDLIQERADARMEKKRLKKAVYDTTVKVREQKDLNTVKYKEVDELCTSALTLQDKNTELRKAIRNYENTRSKSEADITIYTTQLKKQREKNQSIAVKGLQLRNERNQKEEKYATELGEKKKQKEQFTKEIKQENKDTADYLIKQKRFDEVLKKKQKVRFLDQQRNAEQAKVLQEVQDEVSGKEEELAKTRQNIQDMMERIVELQQTHEAIMATLQQQIENCQHQLGKEKKERMSKQVDKDQKQKEIDTFKAEQTRIVNEFNEQIRAGKEQHDTLTKEGNRLRKELMDFEQNISVITTDYESKKKEFLTNKEQLITEVVKLQTDIQWMDQTTTEKKAEIEEKTPGYKVLEVEHHDTRNKYEETKEDTRAHNNKEKSLTDSYKNLDYQQTKVVRQMPDKKKLLEKKRKEYAELLETNSQTTNEIEKQILEESERLKAILEENDKLIRGCNTLETSIQQMIQKANWKQENMKYLKDLYQEVRAALKQGWSSDQLIRQDHCQERKDQIQNLDELLSAVQQRQQVVENVTGQLGTHLTDLAEFLTNMSQRRPPRSPVKIPRPPPPRVKSTPDLSHDQHPTLDLTIQPFTVAPYPATPATQVGEG